MAESGPVGFAAFHAAGSVPLILVDPGYQRHEMSTSLLEAAPGQTRASWVSRVSAGSSGASYLRLGVPHDLPGAISFLIARRWQHTPWHP